MKPKRKQTHAEARPESGGAGGGEAGAASGPAPPAALEKLPGVVLAGVTALLVLSTLIPSEAVVFGGFAPIQMLWLAALAVWSVVLLLGQQRRIVWDAALTCFGLAVGWVVLSAALCDGNRRQAWNIAWQWLSYGAAFFLLRQLATTARRSRALLAVMLALAAALSGQAFYQYFVSQPIQQAEFRRNPERFMGEMGVFDPPGSPRWQHAENRILSREPLATFSLTNSLAGFLAPCLLVSVGVGLAWLARLRLKMVEGAHPDRQDASAAHWDWAPLAGTLVVGCLLAYCLLLTKSRTGMLAVVAGAAGLGVAALWSWRQSGQEGRWSGKTLLGLGAAGTLVGFALLGLAIQTKGVDWEVLSESLKSFSYRLEYWRSSAAMIGDHPWLGVGPGNFKEHYARYQLPQASETVADPHNFLLELAANAGLPALAALLATLVVWAWSIGRPVASLVSLSRSEEQAEQFAIWSIYAGATWGVFLALPIGLAVDLPLEAFVTSLPVIWLSWFLLGLPALLALHRWVEQGGEPRLLAGAAGLVLLINLLAAGALAFAGVMVTLWVSLAIVTRQEPDSQQPANPRWCSVGVSLGAWAMAFACYAFNLPQVTALNHLIEARSQWKYGHFEAAEREFLRACEIDPLAPAGWESLAQLRLGRYSDIRSLQAREEFLAAAEEFRLRNPHHFVQFHQRGRWYLMEWRVEGDPQALARAITAFEQAAEHFPAAAVVHAQLALVYDAAGRTSDAQREAETAAQLDAINPHQDRKLANERLFLPEPLAPPGTPQSPPAAQTAKEPAETAELIVARLRKLPREPKP